MRSAGLRLLRRGGSSGGSIGPSALAHSSPSLPFVSSFLRAASAAAASASAALPSPVAPPPAPGASSPAPAPRPARGRRATTVPSPSPPPAAYDYQPGVLGEPDAGGRGGASLSADLYDVGGGGGGGGGYGGGAGGGGSSFAAAAAPSAAYTSWDVYKSKAALSARVIRPRWRAVGPSASAVALEREGVFLFELAPAAPDGGGGSAGGGGGAPSTTGASAGAPGTRRYDWASKLNVALSVSELGAILADPEGPHEFFHDPQKGRDGEGATRKTVRWAAAPDGRSFFFQLTVTGGAGGGGGSASSSSSSSSLRQSVSVPVSKGELYVLRRLVDFSIPYLLGFDAAFAEMVAGGGGGNDSDGGVA